MRPKQDTNSDRNHNLVRSILHAGASCLVAERLSGETAHWRDGVGDRIGTCFLERTQSSALLRRPSGTRVWDAMHTRLRARACKHGKNCVTCVKRCAGSSAPRAIRWPLDPVPNASMGSVSTCIGNCAWLFLGYHLRHNTTAQWSVHDALRQRAVMTLTAGAPRSLRYLICCSDRTDCTASAATTAWAKGPRVARPMRPSESGPEVRQRDGHTGSERSRTGQQLAFEYIYEAGHREKDGV